MMALISLYRYDVRSSGPTGGILKSDLLSKFLHKSLLFVLVLARQEYSLVESSYYLLVVIAPGINGYVLDNM
jgi:hypothetical protein